MAAAEVGSFVEAFGAWLDGLGISLTVFLAIAVVLLVVTLGLYDGRFLLVSSILAYAAPLISSSVIPSQPFVYVAAALGLIVLLGMTRGRMPRFRLLRSGIFPATAVYLVLGMVLLPASVDTGESLLTALTVLIAGGYVWTMLSVCTYEEIRSSFRIALGLLALASVVYVFANPAVGVGDLAMEIDQNRWRGVMENPNGLGVIAALAFVLAPRRSASIPSLVAAGIVLLGSGSRSATLALGIVVWPRLFGQSTRLVRRISVVIAILLALPLLYSVFFSEGTVVSSEGSGVLRVVNTRAESWEYATDSIASNLWGGLGIGNSISASGERQLGVASSVLRPMTELGLPALLPLAMVAAVGLRHIRSRESSMRTLLGFMLIHGIFEGWVFAGGSALFVIFMVAASLVDLDARAARQERSQEEPPFDETAVPGKSPVRSWSGSDSAVSASAAPTAR